MSILQQNCSKEIARGEEINVAMLCDTGCNIDLISLDTAKKLMLKISKDNIYKIKDAQDNFLKAVGETTMFVSRKGTQGKAVLKPIVFSLIPDVNLVK